MSRKQDIIAAMLRRYDEAQETLNGPDGIRGDGDSITLMPSTWTPEYRELERCLKQLRAERPVQYWHLAERYLRSKRKRVELILRENGDPKLPPHSELESIAPMIRGRYATVIIREWSPKVRAEKARRALDYLAANYQGEPRLHENLRSVQAA